MTRTIELLIASLTIAWCFDLGRPVLQADERPGLQCGGSTNCKIEDCVNQPQHPETLEVYSCGVITAIDHKKCGPGGSMDCCNEKELPCAEIEYFAGGNCTGSPASCPGNSLDIKHTYKEPGCRTEEPCLQPPGQP